MSTWFGTDTGAQFNPNVWAAETNKLYKRNLVIAGGCTDKKGDSKVRGFTNMYIPNITGLNSTAPRSRATIAATMDGGLTYDANTDTYTTLTIDKYYYQGIGLGEFEDNVSGYDILNEYTPVVAEALARYFDYTLADLFSTLTNTIGALTDPPTEDDFLYLAQLLLDADVPRDNWMWFISNPLWGSLMKQQKLTSSDFVGSKPLETGAILNLYGTPAKQSNNLEGTAAAGHYNALLRKNCIIYAQILAPKTRRFDDIDLLAEKLVMSSIWGVAVNRQDSGAQLKGP